jgi:hypothetical protein
MFLASGAVPRRRWGCGTTVAFSFLIIAGSLWLAFRPTAVGHDRDDSTVSPHPPTDIRRN